MDVLGIVDNFTIMAALFFIFGLVLVVLEMFHPGFGLPGTLGAGLLIAAVYLTATNVWEALALISVIFVILGLVLILVIRSAKQGKLSKTLVLSDTLRKDLGFSGTENLEEYLGKKGRTLTALHPSGTAEFDGMRLDVVSEGEYLPKDVQVRIFKVEGRRVVVKQIKE
jgi:membrane-bound ClpP family serine protease